MFVDWITIKHFVVPSNQFSQCNIIEIFPIFCDLEVELPSGRTLSYIIEMPIFKIAKVSRPGLIISV